MKDLHDDEVDALDAWMLLGIIAFVCIIGFDVAALLIHFGVWTP